LTLLLTRLLVVNTRIGDFAGDVSEDEVRALLRRTADDLDVLAGHLGYS